MGIVIDLAARRREKAAATAAAGAPSETNSEEYGLAIWRRTTLRNRVATVIGAVENRIAELKGVGIRGDLFTARLEALMPEVAEFYRMVPESKHPYSPQMSDSTVILSPEESEKTKKLIADLRAVLQFVENAFQKVGEIDDLTVSLRRLSNIVEPRSLRMVEWDEPDLTVSDVIDAAADPHGLIERAIVALATARGAVGDERWESVHRGLESGRSAIALVNAANPLLVCGVLEQISN